MKECSFNTEGQQTHQLQSDEKKSIIERSMM